ncbi:MAG TPA: hypothetical protein VEL75_01300 [Candidatus Methylomirabilis sp.]|nr:hypothetical protein [Candidatus Methylomirabilis sp.]
MGATGLGAPALPARAPGRRPPIKAALFGAVLLALLAIVALASFREASAPGSRTSRPALAAPRPALTAAEEQYALTLWPIHNEVKAGALKMTLGGLSYKLGELDRAGLKARVEASAETYRAAAARIAALSPPPSLAGAHQMYAEAVRLYQQSAAEMLRTAGDGRDEHLVAAHPLSMEASERLLKVGDVLWPGEYKPN